MSVVPMLYILYVLVAPIVVFAQSDVQGCVPLSVVAEQNGLSAFAEALTAATPALSETDVGREFVEAFQATEVVPTSLWVTYFIPSDAAFAKAVANFGGDIPPDDLPDLLLNHAIFGDHTVEALRDLSSQHSSAVLVMATLSGRDVHITLSGGTGTVFLQSEGLDAPGAAVATADLAGCAGVIHVLDDVLLLARPDGSTADLPVAYAAAPYDYSTGYYDGVEAGDVEGEGPAPGAAVPPALGAAPAPAIGGIAPGPGMGALEGCSSLTAATAAAGLSEFTATLNALADSLNETVVGLALLQAAGAAQPVVPAERLTVFAPSDAAFAAFQEEQLGGMPLEAIPRDVLTQVLLNHVTPGDITAAAIAAEAPASNDSTVTLLTLSGDALRISTTNSSTSSDASNSGNSSVFVQSSGLEAPGAGVVMADIASCAATVHAVDGLLVSEETLAAIVPGMAELVPGLAPGEAPGVMEPLEVSSPTSAQGPTVTVSGRGLAPPPATEPPPEATPPATSPGIVGPLALDAGDTTATVDPAAAATNRRAPAVWAAASACIAAAIFAPVACV